MKRTLMMAMLVLAVFLISAPVFSQCGSSYTMTHTATASTYFTGYTNDPATGGIGGISYVIGKGNTAIGAGTDSDIYPMTANACASSANCQARIAGGNFRVSAATAQGVNAWFVCPLTTDNITVVMWDRSSEGVAGHTGKFVAATAKYSGTTWNYGVAQTPATANGKVFHAIPKVDITSSTTVDATHRHYALTIPTPIGDGITDNTSFKRQYYDSTITPPVVITGWKLYYTQSAAAPTTGDVTAGAWVLVGSGVVNIPDDAATSVSINTSTLVPGGVVTSGSNNVYFAVAPQFADGFTPFTTYGSPYTGYFVGQNSNPSAPTASPVFNNVTADATTANWTSGVETRVASYQLYWAPTLTDTFKSVGLAIPARGDNQSYSTTYRILTTAKSYYVKVRANKTDGTFEYSAPVLVQKSVKPIADRTVPPALKH